jgi:hypothetical protein
MTRVDKDRDVCNGERLNDLFKRRALVADREQLV